MVRMTTLIFLLCLSLHAQEPSFVQTLTTLPAASMRSAKRRWPAAGSAAF